MKILHARNLVDNTI